MEEGESGLAATCDLEVRRDPCVFSNIRMLVFCCFFEHFLVGMPRTFVCAVDIIRDIRRLVGR